LYIWEITSLVAFIRMFNAKSVTPFDHVFRDHRSLKRAPKTSEARSSEGENHVKTTSAF
jgi:hypothetical protein